MVKKKNNPALEKAKTKETTTEISPSNQKLHHKVIGHVKEHKNKFLIGLFSVIIVCLIAVFFFGLGKNNVSTISQKGDTVQVDYIGTLADGTVFDTSIESVARQKNTYNANREYLPFQFILGSGQALGDFDNAVTGMKIGETKTFTVPKEGAYPVDPSLIAKGLPKDMPLKLDYEVTIEQFKKNAAKGGDIMVGNIYHTTNVPFPMKVTAINNANGTVDFISVLNVGDVIPLTGRSWNATVKSVNDEEAILTQEMKVGQAVMLPDGSSGYVTAVDATTYDIDMNLPIAGKDLTFQVTLINVTRH